MFRNVSAAGTMGTLMLLVFFLPASLVAQDEEERGPGWYDEADLSVVLTAGNTRSSAFGLSNELERVFPRSRIAFSLGGIWVESGVTRRMAVGTPGNFDVIEETETETTAENYFAGLRFDRDLGERSYAYVAGGWDRDRFAGIENKWIGSVGLGWKLIESARTRFQADVGVTYTSEELVVGATESFGGLRLTWALEHGLTETTKLTSDLVVDENLSETEDLRVLFDNGIAVEMSELLALRAGVRLKWDNLPAFREVGLFATPGGPEVGTVLAPLDELDTQVTVGVVVTP